MLEHQVERERMKVFLNESESLKEIYRIFLPRLFEEPPTSVRSFFYCILGICPIYVVFLLEMLLDKSYVRLVVGLLR